MAQPNERYAELAQKWLDGTITEEEKKEFAQWYDQDLETPLYIPPAFAQSEEELRRRMLDQILERKDKTAKVLLLSKKAWLQVAAAVVLIAASALFYASLHTGGSSSPAIAKAIPTIRKNFVQQDLAPGGNKAVLLLADGSRIELDTASTGAIAGNGATKVIKLKEGQLRFSSSGQPKEIRYNTLATPRGGQYSITLDDGTTVWLNAASSLRFPTAFTETERVVELSGEAYFEVAKNPRKPFTVKVNGLEVNVLGTHFNVMAYADEATAQTTLLEGAVEVKQNAATALLKPGQQAVATAGGTIKVRKHADVDQVIAWKNGLFNFEGATIETIMRQLARWYPIEVAYTASVPAHFNGTISKHVGIRKVFQMLELTGAVHFSMNGNKVTVGL